jgi:hypothetical protein
MRQLIQTGRSVCLGFRTVIVFALAFALITVAACGSGGGDGSTQHWTLKNDANDLAYVVVKPFAYSGTFMESDKSPGWWLIGSTGTRVARIPMNGTIAHAGQYDTWDFTVTVSGGGISMTAQGTGRTSDGEYPDATQVNGDVTGTATMGAGFGGAVHGLWSGNDLIPWN